MARAGSAIGASRQRLQSSVRRNRHEDETRACAHATGLPTFPSMPHSAPKTPMSSPTRQKPRSEKLLGMFVAEKQNLCLHISIRRTGCVQPLEALPIEDGRISPIGWSTAGPGSGGIFLGAVPDRLAKA